jgi:hypothetical protein
MATSIECTVTASPGIWISCEEREDGVIALFIKPSPNTPDGIEKGEAFGQNTPWVVSEHHHTAGLNKIIFRITQDGIISSKRSVLLQSLATRTRQKAPRRIQKLDENVISWLQDPSIFFGRTTFTSTEQWSSHNLDSAEPDVKRERGP